MADQGVGKAHEDHRVLRWLAPHFPDVLEVVHADAQYLAGIRDHRLENHVGGIGHPGIAARGLGGLRQHAGGQHGAQVGEAGGKDRRHGPQAFVRDQAVTRHAARAETREFHSNALPRTLRPAVVGLPAAAHRDPTAFHGIIGTLRRPRTDPGRALRPEPIHHPTRRHATVRPNPSPPAVPRERPLDRRHLGQNRARDAIRPPARRSARCPGMNAADTRRAIEAAHAALPGLARADREGARRRAQAAARADAPAPGRPRRSS